MFWGNVHFLLKIGMAVWVTIKRDYIQGKHCIRHTYLQECGRTRDQDLLGRLILGFGTILRIKGFAENLNGVLALLGRRTLELYNFQFSFRYNFDF